MAYPTITKLAFRLVEKCDFLQLPHDHFNQQLGVGIGYSEGHINLLHEIRRNGIFLQSARTLAPNYRRKIGINKAETFIPIIVYCLVNM